MCALDTLSFKRLSPVRAQNEAHPPVYRCSRGHCYRCPPEQRAERVTGVSHPVRQCAEDAPFSGRAAAVATAARARIIAAIPEITVIGCVPAEKASIILPHRAPGALAKVCDDQRMMNGPRTRPECFRAGGESESLRGRVSSSELDRRAGLLIYPFNRKHTVHSGSNFSRKLDSAASDHSRFSRFTASCE